jgi:hypothetical protein
MDKAPRTDPMETVLSPNPRGAEKGQETRKKVKEGESGNKVDYRIPFGEVMIKNLIEEVVF